MLGWEIKEKERKRKKEGERETDLDVPEETFPRNLSFAERFFDGGCAAPVEEVGYQTEGCRIREREEDGRFC